MIMREPTLDLNVCSARLLAEEGLTVDKRDEIVELAKNVQSSELWRRACRAEKRFFEVPFALTVPSADVSLEDGPSETILKGVIDLVFREAGTWVIVDYKSDDVGDDHTPLVARYAPQIRQYRRYWKQLTGEETTAAVFFVASGRVEWVE
jgi:ATP-dependent exoDNAse (exonuclease V) beta subunit